MGKANFVRTGKGTWYPGRTKPLNGLRLSPLARELEKSGATFASPCGKKGGVYKVEMIGAPGKYRYALLNDRIGKKSCDQVGHKVPLIDLASGIAAYFGIRGRKGVGTFRITRMPDFKHTDIALTEGLLPEAEARQTR